MSRSLNRVMLIGDVGADPDIHEIQGGKKVASISLATSRRVPQGDDVEERTDWHRLVVWERLAEICDDCVQKGDGYLSRAGAPPGGETRRVFAGCTGLGVAFMIVMGVIAYIWGYASG